MDLYYTDHAQSLTTAGEELDHLDHELSDLSAKCGRFKVRVRVSAIYRSAVADGITCGTLEVPSVTTNVTVGVAVKEMTV